MTRKTVVIFGISSFVGSNLAEFLKDDYKVVGTYYKTPVRIPGVLSIPCNVLSKKEVQFVVYSFLPDVSIYSVGLSSVQECDPHDELAEALNYVGFTNVSEFSKSFGAQVIYFSSAFVFAGERKKYLEIDIPDPNTVLGNSKFSAEFYLQKTSMNYVIFRSCNLYGRGYNFERETFFEMLQKRMVNNRSFKCDGDVIFGFLDVYYIAMLVKLCIERAIKNRLFQVSSSDYMTHYDFAKLYTKIFGGSAEGLVKSKWHYPYVISDASTYVEGANEYQLDINNVENFLNVTLPSVEESLKFTYKRFNGKELKAGSRSKDSGEVPFM